MNIDLLRLHIDSPLVHPGAINFRPSSWPPAADWAPVVDAKGVPQCTYKDSTWPLNVWTRSSLVVSFGDGATTRGAKIDRANANLLRQCAVWFLWGPRGCRAASSFAGKVNMIKPLFAVCSRHGIIASDLRRFDAVIDELATLLSPSSFTGTISILHDLLDAQEELGFTLIDRYGLARLTKLAPTHEQRQTPYIPPRIWSYQLALMRECLEEFAKNSEKVESCFEFCIDAYAKNLEHLRITAGTRNIKEQSPFGNSRYKNRLTYLGAFKLTANRFGICDLLEKWSTPFTGERHERQLHKLSSYLDIVAHAGMAYIITFSLMRIEEAWNLRSDCLLIEKDDTFGDLYLLRGETTKTEQDSDARWPVCKSVALAISVMKKIAALRMKCAQQREEVDVTQEDVENPYLLSYQYEPWSIGKHRSYRTRPTPRDYPQRIFSHRQLLEKNQICIDENDLRIARMMTPGLDEDIFKVGIPWKFGWHQLRRTGAVNMLNSQMVDESSLQLLLKHHSRLMTLYYGRNQARLALSEDTRKLFLNTMYQEMARCLNDLKDARFISPISDARKETIINFIGESDAKSIEKFSQQGKIAARRIRIGFCVNHRVCPYGGWEAITHCLGANVEKGCPDLLMDKNQSARVSLYEENVDKQLKTVHPDSPRHRSLQMEKLAILKFYDIAKAQNI